MTKDRSNTSIALLRPILMCPARGSKVNKYLQVWETLASHHNEVSDGSEF